MADDSTEPNEFNVKRDGKGKEFPIVLTTETPLAEAGIRVIGMAYGSCHHSSYSTSAEYAEAYMRNSAAKMGGDCIINPEIHQPLYMSSKIYVMMHCKVGVCTEVELTSGNSE